MAHDKLDVLVCGDTAIDYFYEVDKLPRQDEASEVHTCREFYGGMGANTAVVAGNLGLRVGLVSVIGSDAEAYRKYMESQGIKLALKGVFGDTTKSMFYKNNGDQISFFYKGVTEKLDELQPDKEFNEKLVTNADCIFMARTYMNLQKRMVRLCKKQFVVYNPGYGVFKFSGEVPKIFYQVVKKSDVLILNEHELKHLRKLGFALNFKLGPTAFVVTKGGDGCSVYHKNTRIDVKAYPIKVVDASGAGDAFNAGFIAGHAKGYEVLDSVKIGNATASFIAEEWGCQTNLPNWNQVMERYSKIK